jgi:hypothetical protein
MQSPSGQPAVSIPGEGRSVGGIENGADVESSSPNEKPSTKAESKVTSADRASEAQTQANSSAEDEQLPHSLVNGSAMASANAPESRRRE